MSRGDAGIERTARATAKQLLRALPTRYAHTAAVARATSGKAHLFPLSQGRCLVAAAWLHDIGYAPTVLARGFHPLDGAQWLSERSWNTDVVALVAHHSCAEEEAVARGLTRELSLLPDPDPWLLEVLTWADMTTSPKGNVVTVHERLGEISERYAHDDPVSIAVRRSAPTLIATVEHVEHWFRQWAQPM